MKTDIHPKLQVSKVTCTGCGHEFETLSVLPEITVGICSNCHPFFTGTKKLVDTEGRIEKFQRRYGAVKSKKRQQKDGDSGDKQQHEQDQKETAES